MKIGCILLAYLLFPLSVYGEDPVHGDHIHGTVLEAEPYSSDSLFLTDSVWTSSDTRKLKLGELRGKPRVIALFYASCSSACPLIVDAMKRVEKELAAKKTPEPGFVLVTFDPEDDTAAVLKRYAEKRGLRSDRWLLLRGADDDVRELAVLLGSKFKRMGPKNFAHSNVIALLDSEGRIVARAKALDDIDRFAAEVSRYLGHSAKVSQISK